MLLIIVCGSYPLFGQNEAKIDCGSVAKRFKPKSNKIVSLGVINGKAIDIVKPDFPAAARAVSAHGAVEVSVLIDTRGCVVEAKAHSGHPLLIPATLQAARKSTFLPATLSGNPVWAYGIITYNFLPKSLNWLELGLASDEIEKLIEYLPSEFDLRRKQLKNIRTISFEDRPRAASAVLDSIHADLSGEPKQQWLFDAGRSINDIARFNFIGRDGLNSRVEQLQQLVDSVPQGVSPQLVVALRRLTVDAGAPDFWKQIKGVESRSFNFGM